MNEEWQAKAGKWFFFPLGPAILLGASFVFDCLVSKQHEVSEGSGYLYSRLLKGDRQGESLLSSESWLYRSVYFTFYSKQTACRSRKIPYWDYVKGKHHNVKPNFEVFPFLTKLYLACCSLIWFWLETWFLNECFLSWPVKMMHHKTLFFMKKHYSTNCISSIKHIQLWSSYLNPCGDKIVIVLRDYEGNCDSSKDRVFRLISITVM